MMEKPYFPMFLGNGVDSVLLDYSGSMSCESTHLHMEQNQGIILAWYKSTYRELGKTQLPIIQSSYTLIGEGGEVFEAGEFDQRFDPERAALTTLVTATDFEVKVESFLTSSHVLVERFTFLKTPKADARVGFNFVPPNPYWANGVYEFADPMKHSFTSQTDESLAACDFDIRGIRGSAFTLIDVPVEERSDYRGGLRLTVSNLRPGSVVTRFTAVIDDRDTPGYASEIIALLQEVKSSGYEGLRRSHEAEWLKFHSRSNVKLPDKWMEYMYHLSLYVIRAVQNQTNGLVTCGNYPSMWGGGVTAAYDATFPNTALLMTNHVDEAEKLASGFQGVLPIARRYASELGAKGAYVPHFMDSRGYSTNFRNASERPKMHKLHNGCLVMQIWNLYLYTGDCELLRKYWDVISETVEFLLTELVEFHGDEAVIKAGEGADESIDRINDTMTLQVIIKSLEAAVEGGALLDIKTDPVYPLIIDKLKKSLERNYDGRTLMPHAGAKGLTGIVFKNYLFYLPDGITKESIERGLIECQGKWGLSNPGAYQNLIWPWNECTAAAALAYMADRRACGYLEHAIRFTSTLGAFPEKIRPDGYWINFFYPSAHSCLVWAVNAMLAHSKRDVLRVLPGVPARWKELSFENLRVTGGVLISAEMKNGKLDRLRLKNDSPEPVTKKLKIQTRFLREEHKHLRSASISLAPEEAQELLIAP